MFQAREVWKYLPIGNLVNWDNSSNLKKILHILYAGVGIIYLTGVINHGLLTPKDYKEFFKQKEEVIRQEEGIDDILFGERGLVDKNGDGKLSTLEKTEFLIRAGRENELTDRIRHVYLTIEEKKKAIRSYESGEKIE